jgi:hypothetical protein
MDWIQSALIQLSQWTQPYYSEIALVILTTILVVYGDVFNKHIKRMISPHHFVIRTTIIGIGMTNYFFTRENVHDNKKLQYFFLIIDWTL